MKLVLKKELEGTILDIGGGGEGILGRLYGQRVIAIDRCQEELDEAPGGFQKMRMDATKLEFGDECFENVTFFYTLMYMNEDAQRQAIREAARVLKKGGHLYLWDAEIVSAYPEPFCAELDIDLPEEHIHTTYGIVKQDPQTLESVEKMCTDAGLCVTTIENQSGHFFLCCKKSR